VPALVRMYQEGEAGGSPDQRMERYLAGQHHPQQALLPRVMWMATEMISPIGYVAGYLSRRFDCEGELQWIYVIPERRDGHVAAELLRRLAAWFVEQRALRVCVNVSVEHARHFYRRHGALELSKHWMVWDDISIVVKNFPASAQA
jgi:ribosomal protein S18 acetylase RimI-like enzyme